jgi:hypothetical protein
MTHFIWVTNTPSKVTRNRPYITGPVFDTFSDGREFRKSVYEF